MGFSAIRLSFELDTDADDEQLATLQKLTERYCVVYQTLASGPRLETSFSAGRDGSRSATSLRRETLLARGQLPGLDRATIHPYVDATPGPVYYQRFAHPVGLEAEAVLGELDGGAAALFPSGAGATTALMLALLEPGATVAVADGGYWGTFGLLHGELARWGLNVITFDQTGAPPPADLVWLEPCSNPLMTFPDLDGVDRRGPPRRRARRRRQHRAEPGAAAPARAWRRFRPAQRHQDPRRPSRRAGRRGHLRPPRGPRPAGGVPIGHRHRGRAGSGVAAAARHQDARGARGAPVRQRAGAGAPPGRSSAGCSVSAIPASAIRSPRGTSTPSDRLLSFDVADGDTAARVERSLELIENATSLGGVASTLEARARWEGSRVPAGLLRLSVGLEHVDDLWADLSQALDGV